MLKFKAQLIPPYTIGREQSTIGVHESRMRELVRQQTRNVRIPSRPNSAEIPFDMTYTSQMHSAVHTFTKRTSYVLLIYRLGCFPHFNQ